MSPMEKTNKAEYHHSGGILPFVLRFYVITYCASLLALYGVMAYVDGALCANRYILGVLSLYTCFRQHKGQLGRGGTLAVHIS